MYTKEEKLVDPFLYCYALVLVTSMFTEYQQYSSKELFVKPTVQQLVNGQGFPYEEHKVTTPDGYVLTMHRIPNTGPPVMLQHGVLDSAASWVFMDSQNALVYLLSAAGFDVWFGSTRGASKHHLNLTYDDSNFWNWNTDDLIREDLPTMVNHVVWVSGFPKISYIGHSMGSLMGFASFTNENSALADKIQAFVALAPAASFKKPASIIDQVAPSPSTVVDLLASAYTWLSPARRFHVWDTVREGLFISVCPYYPGFCRACLCAIAGCHDAERFPLEDIPVILSMYPAEASMNNLAQFAQWESSQKVAKFDYKEEENMVRYGQPTPPLYNITDLSVPVAIFYGGADKIVTPYRVLAAVEDLPRDKVAKVDFYPDFGHADFVWGTEGRKQLFPDIISYLQSQVV